MAEQPRPCPHCQGTDLKILPRNSYDGGGFVLTCQSGDCIARIWGHDQADVIARWNRRTPPPATAAMLEWLRGSKRSVFHPLEIELIERSLAEWNQLPPE